MARYFRVAIVGGFVLVGLLHFALIAPMNASAQATTYSFNLLGPNTAVIPGGQPDAGLTLRLTGSGSFDTTTGAVTGGGTFKVITPSGTVIDRGTYVLTTFLGFKAYGGPNPGQQGGFLEIIVTATSSVTGLVDFPHMTVSCAINAPPGAPPEGITGDVFTQSTGGRTLFHLGD